MLKRLRRFIPYAVGLAVLSGLVYAFMPQPVDVDLAPVRRGALMTTVDEDGKTRVKERYVVSAPLDGRLQRIALHAGDAVEAGVTVLATIEPNEPKLLDARASAEAEARVKAAEATKSRAVPLLEAARSNYHLAETTFARIRRLSDRGMSSKQEIDDAEQKFRTASEEVRAAQFAEQVATFELEQARAALLRTKPQPASPKGAAPAEPPRFEVRSPVSGRVLRVVQESAAAVTAGTKLLEVGDPSNLECEIDVLSTDAVKIRPGARAIIEHWGGDEPLEGRVRVIEPSAFTKTSALGVEEQRVYVLIDFTDPLSKRPTLGDEYRVEARIVVWEADDVLKVPAGALFRHGESWAVYRVETGRARLRALRLGHNNGLEAEVLSGLEPDDHVVVHPSDKIGDGTKVRGRDGE